MRARFLPKFWSPCMRGIRSCGCRGTSSLQTSRSASSDRRFQRPRVPLEGAEKFSRVASPPLTFYTDYFTRIIYIAFYFPLSRVLVFRRKDARSPQTCDSIDRSVISTLERLKRNFFFLFFFVLQKLHGYIHGWAWTFPDKECNLFSWPRLQARNLSCKWHNTKVKLLT